MTSWHSYSKIWSIGHPQAADLFKEEVLIEEKVDGSQFSFGLIDGVLRTRSRGREFEPEAADSLFTKAVETAVSLRPFLHPGWTYRGEYLQKPKHNTLAYTRVPEKNIILFDIGTGDNTYLSRQEKHFEAARLGLECVPVMFEGKVDSAADFYKFLEATSCLGGAKVEGVVAKNYARHSIDGKTMMGKYVSEQFKEVHRGEWAKENPQAGDIFLTICGDFRSEARWDKAVQHLREAGQLKGDPSDIGLLFKEVKADVEAECRDEIKERLYSWFKKKGGTDQLVRGLAEWYKKRLLESAFGGGQ